MGFFFTALLAYTIVLATSVFGLILAAYNFYHVCTTEQARINDAYPHAYQLFDEMFQ